MQRHEHKIERWTGLWSTIDTGARVFKGLYGDSPNLILVNVHTYRKVCMVLSYLYCCKNKLRPQYMKADRILADKEPVHLIVEAGLKPNTLVYSRIMDKKPEQ